MPKNPIESPQSVEKPGNKTQSQVEAEAYNNKNRGNTKEEK